MTKTTFVTKEQLEKITADFPTPFHLYDEHGIRETARALHKAFAWNKGFREYFAVKATPNPAIMSILREEGCGFDCASLTELMLAERVGAVGNDVIFSSNQTPDEDYRLASKLGVYINLDDFTHIDILDKLCGIPETIFCRYNPGNSFEMKNSGDNEENPEDEKYGFTKEQLFEGYRILRDKGAKKFGIHSFLSCVSKTENYYPVLARNFFETAVELKEKTGISLNYVNLSGGIGIAYRPEDVPNDIAAIGAGVEKAFNEVLIPNGLGDISIFTELGRFMLAPHGCLVTRAIREKHTYKEYIGVDACAANLMRPAIYKAYHHITVAGKENAPCNYKYDIVGGLCENNDKFAVDRMLPQIDTGDLLIIHDTGAHGFSMGYNYNGKLKSAELLLREDGSVKQIRRAETPADYFATLEI